MNASSELPAIRETLEIRNGGLMAVQNKADVLQHELVTFRDSLPSFGRRICWNAVTTDAAKSLMQGLDIKEPLPTKGNAIICMHAGKRVTRVCYTPCTTYQNKRLYLIEQFQA